MSIISVLNPKGGSGKTTLSTNIARALHDRSFSVLLVDTDPQGSARDWHAETDDNPLPLVALDRAANLKSLPGVAASYDYAIIDGAAKLEDMAAASIAISDAVLIPVQPSPYDIWAMSDLVTNIETRHTLTAGKPKAAFLISRAIQNTRLSKEIISALGETAFPLFNARTIQRQVYPQTAADGLTVFDVKHPQAVAEVNAIVDELLVFLKGGLKDDVICQTA